MMKTNLFLLALLWVSTIAKAQDYSDQVRQTIVPWVESVGQLFGLSEEGLDSLQWNESYTQSCTASDYRRLEAAVKNPANYHCPTGYYRLSSSRGGNLFLESDNLQTDKGLASHAADVSSVVRLERAADGGFYIRMQDGYLYPPVKDRVVTAGIVPQKFYPVVRTPGGLVAFTAKQGTYSALYCGVNRVTGNTLTDNASYWAVTPAADVALTAPAVQADKYYATLFAPFDLRVADSGLEAFTLAKLDGEAVATARLTTIPAMTPVLLRGNSKTMKLALADESHDVVAGNLQLRNTVADLAYSYFNRAFLVYGGEGNGNLTYYRTRIGTDSKLYFWQQALVILTVEDRHDFRPDPSLAPLITELLDAFSQQEGGSGINNTWRTESTYAQQHGLSDWTWNEYNDDLLWAGLAYIRGYLITGEQRFLDQAKWDFDFMYNRGWDEKLGGGIWWDIRKNEKSGLSNNPAVCMASYLYMATGDEAYLDKAKKIFRWVNSHLRNNDGSVDEKMNADGSLGRSYNVYNMGTYVEGASLLYRLTNQNSYATVARKTIEYVMVNRVDGNGIMSAYKVDGTWQSEFARGMATYLAANPTHWTYKGIYTAQKKPITYFDWMRLNADAAWNTRDLTNNITGCEWNKQTPTMPANGLTWEADACCSAMVMINVTPEVVPGSADEVMVDIDDHSADYAYTEKEELPDEPDTPEEPAEPEKITLDESGVMRVGQPIRVACIGNSITEGYGLSSQAKSWPMVLGQLLGPDYDVRNYGKSGFCMGKNTGDVSYWGTTNFTNAKNLNPDIVIIALGTNDADWWRWPNVKDNFKQDYLDMIAEFSKDGRNPIVFCAYPPPCFTADKERQMKNIESEVMPIVRQVAAQVNGYVLDFHSELTSRSDLFPDHLHPNDQGAAVLARIAHDAIKSVQTLTAEVTVSDGEVKGQTVAVVAQGGTVTISPTAGSEGDWLWTGPGNFSSTERVLTLTDVQQGGVYTVQFTDGAKRQKMQRFLVSVKGQRAGTISSYWMTNGSWHQSAQVTVAPDKTLSFGPQISTGNDNVQWSWRGPCGFFAVGREVSIPLMSTRRAGEYGVTCTDARGRQTTAVFNVTVEGQLECPTLVPHLNNGSWQQTTEATVAAGSSVTFGPQPIDGDWTWSGPDGFTYTGREARVNNFNAAKAGQYVATRTTEGGCYDQLRFTLRLK